jgi:hypothetical protein
MSYPKITDEQFLEELRAGMPCSEIAIKYKLNYRSIMTRKARLRSEGALPAENFHELQKRQMTGTSILYDSEGNTVLRWVKTSQEKVNEKVKIFKEALNCFIEELPKFPKSEHVVKDINNDLMAVYPLGDPHIGMLSWEQETGENWDLSIAEQTFINVFDRVIKTAPKCGRAVILNLGDFFHYDNMDGTTSRSGNILDRDGRYAKMVQVGIKIIRRMIETALEIHETVEVITLPGNHDDISSIFLAIALKHIYEKEPRVIIDTNPGLFHYIRFGKNLIGSHHGHTCKMANLPAVMAADKHKDWGETEYRYWLTGHVHHDSKKEYPGCVVESFRTLAAKDAWATSGGYRSGRDTKIIVYHKEYGKIEEHVVNLAMVSPKTS